MKKIKFPFYTDKRGDLFVLEKCLPFEVKRIYFMKNMSDKSRGFHRHKETIQAIIALHGSFNFHFQFPNDNGMLVLDSPEEFVVIPPECYHYMTNFSKDCLILVLASKEYDADDYITTPY